MASDSQSLPPQFIRTTLLNASPTIPRRDTLHPALDNADIVLEILAHLSSSDLASFAQTCRAYFQAWVPFGWKDVTSDDVYRLLGTVAHAEDEACPYGTVAVSNRFKLYSASIQHLEVMDVDTNQGEMPEEDNPQRKGCLLAENTEVRQHLRSFFPAVNTLNLRSTTIPALAYLFVTPQLRNVVILASDTTVPPFLVALQPLAASLQAFSINGAFKDVDPPGSAPLLAIIEQSRNLKRASVCGPQHGIELMGASQGTLELMAIRGHPEETLVPSKLHTPERLTMPKLKRLVLGMSGLKMISLFSCLNAPLLSDITFDVLFGTEPQVWTRTLEMLPWKTLRSFSFRTIAYLRSASPVDPFGVHHFQFLLQHARLSLLIIQITWTNTLSLKDTDIAAMARAWPQLEVLVLSILHNRTLTVQCLESLREYCPKLHHIEFFDLDVARVPPPKHDGYASQGEHVTLSVTGWPIPDVDPSLLRYLRSLWANAILTPLEWDDMEEDEQL